MNIKKFQRQADLLHFLDNDPELVEHRRFEAGIVDRHRHEERFLLEGYCKVCDRAATFLVDAIASYQTIEDGHWIPNWRERLLCTDCHLNNRQRAMFHLITGTIEARAVRQESVSLYATEQITPLFKHLERRLGEANCVGSEYLGEQIASGTIMRHGGRVLRHEDVESLSFSDGSFDFITSNDVLEHVNSPQTALAELYRILKPQGEVFITVPMSLYQTQTVRRAIRTAQDVRHLLPPVYHGNPISEEGSLVFNDFGWDFIEALANAGFQQASLGCYWSYFYGYLGEPQYFLWSQKPG